ncbi:MAG TPA: type I-E CRISPR-associated protein Cse1/CasA [Victivallales bacterium]|nr:type I-E CRISPR-associated protein Cse1/CasA [Victivallales bacterium]
MNLTTDGWIPVVTDQQGIFLASLKDIYKNALSYRDLALNPPQRISVMRLLICITQAALDGPDDEKDWLSCESRIIPESLKYLEKHSDKFDLYGDKPFLQVAKCDLISNAVCDKLNFGLAAGDNQTLFDHGATTQGRIRDDAWLALNILTYHCFCPSGLIGETKWANSTTGKSSSHAPCIQGNPLHTILKGGTILETIHLNLLTKKTVIAPNCKWGFPVWENMPSSQNDSRDTYLGRLVPLSRLIKVETQQIITLANGLKYSRLPASRESMMTVCLDENE